MRLVHILLSTLIALVLLSGASVSTAARQAGQAGPVADMVISTKEIRWEPRAPHAGLTLTLATPSGAVVRQEFAPGTTAALSIVDSAGQRWIDGGYTYELAVAPIIDEATRQQLAAASEADRAAVVAQLQQSGALPVALTQSGHFQIAGGAFVVPVAGPEPTAASGGVIGPQDVVIADDQIVQSSLCVGLDCVDGESFGFDTLRLKENNTRIGFSDTSATAGFATNDWQLTANDSGGGGAEKFSIDDITGAKTPFTIIAGAPTNALFVSSTGDVGLGTATPGLDLHFQTTDTPAIRLEQTNGGGFNAQTWDVGGNESNFFVRDLTGGSLLPFRIRPGAPTSSIDIAASGNVGIGTASPQHRLHVNGNVQVEGRLVELSDANAKQDFVPVDGQTVLMRLRAVPISTWRYRTDESGARHMGPTAQDFFAAFGLGEDERHIGSLDINGVTLAAIKALDEQAQARDARIAELEQQNADLEARLARLEAAVAALAEK